MAGGLSGTYTFELLFDTSRTVQFRYSKDGGENWSEWRDRSLGEVGAFQKRVTFNRFGKGRQWVFDIKVTSPCAAHLIAASYDLEGADS